jgi:hypothetical protein
LNFKFVYPSFKVQDVSNGVESQIAREPDAQFGGQEARKELERTLLRKLDMRLSILILIYVLNCAYSKFKTWSWPLQVLRY